MSNKIELTEEQFKKVWKCCSDNYEVALSNAKTFDYIKQDPVEKAKERINNFLDDGHDQPYIITEAYFKLALEAIEYLEEK